MWRVLLKEPASAAYTPQALFDVIRTTPADGEPVEVMESARRLRREFPDDPWTARLAAERPELFRRAEP